MSQSDKPALRRPFGVFCLALAMTALGAVPAIAGSSSGTLTVRVVVVAPCDVTAGSCRQQSATPSSSGRASAGAAASAYATPMRIRQETGTERNYRTVIY